MSANAPSNRKVVTAMSGGVDSSVAAMILHKENYDVVLYEVTGKVVEQKTLYQGSTIVYFDTKTLYSGVYFVKIIVGDNVITKKIIIEK